MSEPIPSAQPRRVLVTGATGFVGTHVFRELGRHLPDGCELIGCSRNSCMLQGGRVSVALDISDSARIEEAICELRPTNVVHLASVTTLREAGEDPAKTWQANVMGPLHIGRALVKHCPGAQMLYIGSAEVYGGAFSKGAVDEKTLIAPHNTYAYTKAAAELLLSELSRTGLAVVRARPFVHIGPGQSDRFAISAFASQIARIEHGMQEPVLFVGNLDNQRDFLDVRDVAAAYVAIVKQGRDLPNDLVLNLASGKARTIRSALNDLLSLAKVPIEVRIDPERMRPSETPLVLGDATLAKELLGWEPRIPWMQTLKDILDDWRERKVSS